MGILKNLLLILWIVELLFGSIGLLKGFEGYCMTEIIVHYPLFGIIRVFPVPVFVSIFLFPSFYG